jgi:hypothetical protein
VLSSVVPVGSTAVVEVVGEVVGEVVVGDEVEVVVEVEVGSGTSVDAVAPGPVVCVASVALEVLLPVELPPSSPPQALATRDIASIVARELGMGEISAAMVTESPLRPSSA